MTSTSLFSRRALLWSGGAFGGLVLLGCSEQGNGKPTAKARPAGARLTMYKDPNCGCCGKWGEQASAAGFQLAVVETGDILALKRKLGIPEQLYSCHTTVAGPYVIEGHVPFAAVKRLLRQRPKIKGIAVPGMPLGSPGMEVPGRKADQFDIISFDAAGTIGVFG